MVVDTLRTPTNLAYPAYPSGPPRVGSCPRGVELLEMSFHVDAFGANGVGLVRLGREFLGLGNH